MTSTTSYNDYPNASSPALTIEGNTRLPSLADGEEAKHPEAPYSIYTQREKWAIVIIASFAGLFSPLTANIYFPAIPTLVIAFNKTTELINLTVTMYMVLQGISPMIFGTLADTIGRRPISCACLVILSLSCVGLALVPTSAYWLLLVLRCVQAAGSASSIALGAGVIGDISTSAERAGYFGIYNVFAMIGPAIGPVMGGALAGGLGWRSIFWFLCIGSAACAVVVFLFLPETVRSICGNGSIVPSRIYRPIIPLIGSHRGEEHHGTKHAKPTTIFRNPLPLLKEPDILMLLVYNGIIYAVFYSVTASISTLFRETYPYLDETTVGLCFLAVGGGQGIGSYFTGRLLDWEFRNFVKKTGHGFGEDDKLGRPVAFPIETARLRSMPIFLVVYVAACVGYGWCLRTKTNIAGPLILEVIIGYVAMSVMNATQTLLIDLAPEQSSSITACNNLIRCSLGAVAVALIDLILRRMGVGWTYVLLGGICVIFSPLLYAIIHIGPRCRERRQKADVMRLDYASPGLGLRHM